MNDPYRLAAPVPRRPRPIPPRRDDVGPPPTTLQRLARFARTKDGPMTLMLFGIGFGMIAMSSWLYRSTSADPEAGLVGGIVGGFALGGLVGGFVISRLQALGRQ